MDASLHAPAGNTRFLPRAAAAGTTRPRANRWQNAFAFAIGGAIGLIGVWTGKSLAEGTVDAPLKSILLALGFAALALWPNIVLHEAGHALAGMARGMRPVAFGIGPLRWDRGRSRWRFRRGHALGGVSGFAALLPQGGRGLSRADQMVWFAGGPLANLAFAALCYALRPLVDEASLAASALRGFGGCALLLGAANLVPFHSQGWRSDGQGLLDLVRRSPDGDLHLRVHRLLALGLAGVRPRDWPAGAEPPPSHPGASPLMAANADLLRLAWAMDRDDRIEADRLALRLGDAHAQAPTAFRPHLAVMLGWHAARHLRDREVLAAWRALCEGGVTDLSLLRAWLDAELQALSGDGEATRHAVARARGLLDHAFDPATEHILAGFLDDLSANAETLDQRSPAEPVKDA